LLTRRRSRLRRPADLARIAASVGLAGAARRPAGVVHRADGGHRTDAGDRAGDARQAGVAAFRPDVSAATLRRGRLVALGVGGFLLPWCVLLGVTLPATAQVQNWSLAWVGLDAGEAIAALSTAVLLARADSRASVTAAAGGALLVADAWFDVCTSTPDYRVALAEAVFVELPLAAAAFWLAARLARGARSARSATGTPGWDGADGRGPDGVGRGRAGAGRGRAGVGRGRV
jgi:hypothetical protein